MCWAKGAMHIPNMGALPLRRRCALVRPKSEVDSTMRKHGYSMVHWVSRQLQLVLQWVDL